MQRGAIGSAWRDIMKRLLALAALCWLVAVVCPDCRAEDFALSPQEKAWLAAHPVVNIRVSRDYPPFEFYADGRYQGIAVDYLAAVSRRLGVEFRPVEGLTWPQSLDELRQRGKVDAILLITHTAERESFVNFTRDYVSFPWVVFTRKDAPPLPGVSALDGRIVAVEKGFVASDWLKRDIPGVRLLEVNYTRDALETVLLGQADAYLGNLAVGSYLIARDGLVDLKIAASTPEAPDQMGMGVRKDWPELATLIDRALASMSEEEQRTIRQKWLTIRYEHGLTRADIFMWVAIVTVIALIWVVLLWLKVIHKRQALQLEVARREERERDLARTLREVEAAHRKLQFMIERNPLGYIEWDQERQIVAWNPAAERLLGWTRNEVLGRTARELGAIPDDEDLRVWQLWAQAKDGTVPTHMVCNVRRNDGEIRRCEFHITPRVDEEGEFSGLVAMVADITDRLRLEEQMVQAEKMLSVGGLAAGLAHEINNPLAGILQNLQVTRQRLGGALERNLTVAAECGLDLAALHCYLERREISRMLDAIGESAERATNIVRNMLNFSRKSFSRPVPSDLRQTLVQALELAASDYDLKKKYDFRQIEILRDFPETLPLIGCEPTEIQQVFLNLLKNGAQAMAEKAYPPGERPRFTLRIAVTDVGGIRVEIGDNGPGMKEEVRRRVFEPFFSTKEPGSGTGLGLSVSYFIVVEHHDGTLEVSSQEGKGSTFVVTLPPGRVGAPGTEA